MKKLTTLIAAFLFTAGMAFAQSNEATIDQAGDDHEATIDQMGNMNKAFVDQTDGGGGSTGNAKADIKQSGDENFVNLRQVAFFGQLFGDSYANIEQLGNFNRVEGQNAGDAFLQSNVGGILDVTMVGDNNTLYSLRGEAQKNGNEFYLDISGNGNDVGLAQEFAFGDVDITGSDNDVSLFQLAGADWDPALYNDAKVSISGDLNTVDIDQRGLSNYSNVDLMGNSNMSTITQTSNFNSASVKVTGSGNTSVITQSN